MRLIARASFALLLFAACTDDNPAQTDGAVERCPEGDVQGCTCDDGADGTKTCDESGLYGACACPQRPDAALPRDVGPRPDAAPECIDGQSEREVCDDGGERVRACVDAFWGPWGPCAGCLDGQRELEACGVNGRGERARSCADGEWSDFGPCADDEVCEDGREEQEACGLNGDGARTRGCAAGQWGGWSECDDPSECVDGALDRRPCGLNGNGRQRRDCADGRWSDLGECDDPDACIDGQREAEACGVEGNGERPRRCVGGQWGAYGPCDDPDLECEDDGPRDPVECGLNGRGLAEAVCDAGRLAFGACDDPDLCVDDSVIRGLCGLNDRGIRARSCGEGLWSEWTECDDVDECLDDSEQEGACGVNGNGARSRACLAGRWARWAPCDDPDVCENGATERDDSGCGLNGNGGRLRACAEGQWGEWGACDDPDECRDGDEEARACGRAGDGERRRSCRGGRWSPWTPCDAEDPCPDPENPECGPARDEKCNGLDDDHDGQVDEGLLEGGAADLDDGFTDAVRESIAAGLQSLRAAEADGIIARENNARHNFLVALAFLEQREGVHAGATVGYDGLAADDQALVVRVIRQMVAGDPALRNPEARPYVYTTGGAAMALGAYLRTGGPNELGGELETTAEQALQNAVTTLHDNQGRSPPNNNGGWNYGAPNNSGDTSTTHFAANGLAAAVEVLGDDAHPPVPLVDYLGAAQSADGGFGYHPGNASSSSMSASGLWMHHVSGTAAADPAVVGAVDWLAANYHFDRMVGGFSPTSTFYYLWAQQKALPLFVDEGDERFAGRDPAEAEHHPGRAGHFYDTAVTMLGWQDDDGNWGTMFAGSPRGWSQLSSHCFALLTLERSFGGVPVDLPALGLRPQCNDEADNDGDGRVDDADPDCAFACTAFERAVAACANHRDDDADGLIDRDDPGCDDGNDDDEANPACSNGEDDDEDGVADWPDEPGCTTLRDDDETDPEPARACANGVDDDGDGATDYDADPECFSAWQDDEAGRFACPGDVTPIWPDVRRIRGTLVGAPNDMQGSCGGVRGGERIFALHIDRPGRVTLTTVHDETLVDTVLYVRRRCSDAQSELACNDDLDEGDPLSTVHFDAEPGVHFVVVDGRIGADEFVLTIER